MATPFKYLSGSDYGDTTKWSDATVPLVNESVTLADTWQGNVDTRIDQQTVDLDNMLIPSWYAGQFGSSASPFIGGGCDLIEMYGQGEFHYECSLQAGSALKVDDCRIHTNAQNAAGSIVTLGSETGDRGTWDRITVSRGNVTLKANIAFGASGVVNVAAAQDSDVSLNVAATDSTLPELNMRGGTVTAENQITLAHQVGGRMFKKTAPIITFHLMGGTCYWTDPTVTGDGVTILVYPGATLDLRNTAQEMVITNVWEMKGATINRFKSLQTFTNHYNLNETA